MSVWVCPGAISLIGALPTRNGQQYELRSLALVDTLACHYVGDPDPAGSIAGYGNITVPNTAQWQVTKTDGDLFPEIAYHFAITQEGTLWQCLDIRKKAWHVGAANGRSVGVLLTGFGRKGRPSPVQVGTLTMLWRNLERHLNRDVALVGHKELKATDCPGLAADEWLAEARATQTEPPGTPERVNDHLQIIWGYNRTIRSAGDSLRSQVLLEAANAIEERVLAIKQVLGLS